MVFISAKSGHNVPPQLLMGIDSPQCRERCHRRGKPQSPLRMHWGSAVPWGLLLVLLATTPTATARTCREAALCCNGRDSSCVVQKAPINSIIEDPVNDKPCYCDHACLKLGDCCDDFKQFCGGKRVGVPTILPELDFLNIPETFK